MSLISELLGGAGTAYITQEGIERARELPTQLGTAATDIAGRVGEAATFRPYTVTAGGASTSFTPEGYEQRLSEQAQGLASGLSGLGQTRLNALGGQIAGLGNLGQQAFQDAQQAMGATSGQFASQLGGLYAGLGEQQISEATDGGLGGLQAAMTTQALQASTGPSQGLLALQGLTGQADFGGATQDVTGAFRGLQAPDVRTGAGTFSQDLLTRSQGMLGAETPTAQSVYDQIRAMQTPEEERQRTALENRLAAQGRLGVQTAQYGGTPEQLALEKAQAEARNQASLQALQTADQLASAQQARATQLGQMGLSAEQLQSQMEAPGFGQQMQLGQAGIQAAQAQSALETQAQARASQLAQLGLSAEQIASQLESEGLRRSQSSAQLAAQLAQTGAGISAQEQQLGQGLLGLGLQAQQLGGQLSAQDIQRAQALAGLGQQATMLPTMLEQGQLGNIVTALQAAGIPQQQALQALQPALTGLQMAQQPATLEAQALANLGQQQLAGIPSAINAEALLRQAQLEGLTNMLGLQRNEEGNYVESALGGLLGGVGDSLGGLLGDGLDWLGGLFGDSSNTVYENPAYSGGISGDSGLDRYIDSLTVSRPETGTVSGDASLNAMLGLGG